MAEEVFDAGIDRDHAVEERSAAGQWSS